MGRRVGPGQKKVFNFLDTSATSLARPFTSAWDKVAHRKITRVEMDDVLLRGVGKCQDRGPLELKLQPGNRCPMDFVERPDAVLFEQFREWRRDFGV